MQTAKSTGKIKGAWIWPTIIVVMLAMHALGTMYVVMWTKVDQHGGGAVVPHAYGKGLQWDQTKATQPGD